MNMDEMDTAIRAAGLGWDAWGAMVVSALEIIGKCNADNCKTHTSTANEAGMTTAEYMPVVLALAGDPTQDPPVLTDRSLLDAASADGQAMRSALDALGVYRSVEAVDPSTGDTVHGAMTIWDSTAKQLAVVYQGTLATTQAYRAQAGLAGASAANQAQALRDLLDGDPTAFDAIMAA